MEEIKVDFSQIKDSKEGEYMQLLMDKAIRDGVQIGIPWNNAVYDYVFSNFSVYDVSSLLGYDVYSEEI